MTRFNWDKYTYIETETEISLWDHWQSGLDKNVDFDSIEKIKPTKDTAHIVKALKMYINALKEAGKTKVVEKRYSNGTVYLRPSKVSNLALEKLQRVLYHISQTFICGSDIDPDSPDYAMVLEEVRKMFGGVDKNGNAARRSGQDVVLSGDQFVQMMWDYPPSVLETTIAVCIVRDMLKNRKLPIARKCIIKVRGLDVNGWKSLAARFTRIIMEA